MEQHPPADAERTPAVAALTTLAACNPDREISHEGPPTTPTSDPTRTPSDLAEANPEATPEPNVTTTPDHEPPTTEAPRDEWFEVYCDRYVAAAEKFLKNLHQTSPDTDRQLAEVSRQLAEAAEQSVVIPDYVAPGWREGARYFDLRADGQRSTMPLSFGTAFMHASSVCFDFDSSGLSAPGDETTATSDVAFGVAVNEALARGSQAARPPSWLSAVPIDRSVATTVPAIPGFAVATPEGNHRG